MNSLASWVGAYWNGLLRENAFLSNRLSPRCSVMTASDLSVL
jgi:nucleoside recognition membrane protein YjiH